MAIPYKRLFFLSFFLLSVVIKGNAQTHLFPVEISVPFAPAITIINGRQTIYYELSITNSGSDTIHLNKLDVIDRADSSRIFSISRDDLKSRFNSARITGNHSEISLAPGSAGVIYMEVSLNKDARATLFHRLEFDSPGARATGKAFIDGAQIANVQRSVLTIGPPLKGGPWAAVYEASWPKGHRRVYYTYDGVARIPGRFAVDFMKLDNTGKFTQGKDDSVRNWFGYGEDVLAVSDGVVAAVRTDFSESPTISGHPAYSAKDGTGNYISLKIGDGQFAFYEHLKPGSIKVKPGQAVKRGQVIASLGFTGQTVGPHLHFHIANNNSPLGAEGIPFSIERFTLMGSYLNMEEFGKQPWVPLKNNKRAVGISEHPAPNSVVKFND